MLHTGAAAPCGLTRYKSNRFGGDYQDSLFACLFNMHKVTRHVLKENGATFTAQSEDFLTSDNLDFHPTDVLEDADGSLIVVDTGGWYKLCCPTSQLEKPDILGAIYRVRRTDAPPVMDPRGAKVAFGNLSPDQLATLLNDPRPTVRRRATDELVRRGADAVPALDAIGHHGDAVSSVAESDEHQHASARRNSVWALSRIDHADARSAVRRATADRDASVRQAAIHSISTWRDRDAVSVLTEVLRSDSLHNRRAAAEAIGRIGDPTAAPALLMAAGEATDRVLEHSLIYALIELDDAKRTRVGLRSDNAATQRAALIALDQMDGSTLAPEDVVALLSSDTATLRDTANWIIDHHLDWDTALVPVFRQRIETADSASPAEQESLLAGLAQFSVTKPVQGLLATSLSVDDLPIKTKLLVLAAMARSGLKDLPPSWVKPLARLLRRRDSAYTANTISLLQRVRVPKEMADELIAEVLRVARDPGGDSDMRLKAFSAIRHLGEKISGESLDFVSQFVDGNLPVSTRAVAVEILASARLDPSQLVRLSERLPVVSPLDINRLISTFERSTDERVGLSLVESLKRSTARASLRTESLKPLMARFPSTVQRQAEELYRMMAAENSEQRSRLEETLSSLPAGDVRRGQEVFHSAKAACAACHAMGYLGGRVGPDLTRIAKIRNKRDLLEAIVFPNASLVQNFEPVAVLTTDGHVINGLVQRETKDELVLATGPDQETRIFRADIEEMRRSKVSIMPAGLDKQLTPQQLSDLVAFLETRK